MEAVAEAILALSLIATASFFVLGLALVWFCIRKK